MTGLKWYANEARREVKIICAGYVISEEYFIYSYRKMIFIESLFDRVKRTYLNRNLKISGGTRLMGGITHTSR